ncbi:hypothetical protein [Arthrobacter sp. ZGTC212]|uniref:hypothetical protein n=1 Tax=Arthrobacter sp. ZGTC212 TaxID=2058899 RepID=UPI0011B0980D|nr:hypothetical protein [Arthrobacter sp. ZGTC212]
MKFKKALTCIVAGALLSLGAIQPAQAASAEDREEISSWFDKHGVSEQTQDRLHAKLLSGKMLDSMKADMAPLTEEEKTAGGFITIISTYPDGSISVSEREQAQNPNGISPRSISGCTAVSGSGYASRSNCLIKESNGYLHLQFRANYTMVNGAADYISWVGNASASSSWGSASAANLSIIRRTESGSPAQAQIGAQFDAYGGLNSYTGYAYLNVGGDSAWSSRNYN